MKRSSIPISRSSRRYITVSGVVVGIVLIGFLLFRFFHPMDDASASTAKTGRAAQQVSLATVASLSPNNAALSVIGQVTSENEATILSQTSGEIVSLNKHLGDSVAAGEAIAVIENSSQRAAVLQAQGAYDAAVANYNQTSGTNAQNSSVTSAQANQNAQSAQNSAAASMHDAYLKVQDALNSHSDVLFNNPQSVNPVINVFVTNDTVRDNINNERLVLGEKLDAMSALPANDFSVQTQAIASDTLNYAKQFLTDLAAITGNLSVGNSALTQAQISADNGAVSAAAIEANAGLSEFVGAQSTYQAAVAGATTATNSATNGTSNSVAIAQANVQSALGSLDAAKAALNKTIITSPIAGKVINLTVTSGDYISSFSQVAIVSNPSALKIITHVNANDAKTLSVGNTVTVDGTISGVITQVAPAIDPQTGTIEVDVALTGDQASLTDGDSVTVDLERTVSSTAMASTTIIIPIVALKITPTGPVVFTIQKTSTSTVTTLSAHPVQIGSILGENILITQGLTPDLDIVTDARGLVDGELVSVKK